MGMASLNKAGGFHRENNWSQVLHYSDLAAAKLKQVKDRPIEAISDALQHKCIALESMGQYKEQLDCAKEWYCLWNTKPTDIGAILAAFTLIQSCLTNDENEDGKLYASTLYEIINHKHDNKIPEDQRQFFIAQGAYYLALATLRLAKARGIPPKEKQKAGQEAIALARRALEIHTQLEWPEKGTIANAMVVLADALEYFNDCDDEEVLRLFEQAKAIFARVFGSSSVNVAVGEHGLGNAYENRARRAYFARDMDRCVANVELALLSYREETRIFRAVGRLECADTAARCGRELEDRLRVVSHVQKQQKEEKEKRQS